MKLCQDHWHELKNAIRQRGLWEFVTPVESSAMQTTQQELETEYPQGQEPLDPLRTISGLISEQAVMAFGAYLLTRNDCPLCEVEYNLGQGTSFEWIEVDADIVLAICRERHPVSRKE